MLIIKFIYKIVDMNFTLKRLISSIISFFVALGVGIAIFFIVRAFQDENYVLETPTQLSYDLESQTLTWLEVEHADAYIVKIDESITEQVSENYLHYEIEKTTAFVVQAIDTSNTYEPSANSVALIVTIN